MHIATYVIILCFMMSSVKAFENETLTPYVQISCCEMLDTLTQYTVDSTGDRVHESCQNHECFKLQIVNLFVNHTRVMLGNSISAISIDDNHIKIDKSSLLENSKTTLVLALLGRASLPEKLRESHTSLEYNKALNILSVKNSTCTTDKTIYSTIIIASISLLLFFIATNLVNSQQENHNIVDAAVSVDAAAIRTGKMQFLRMKF